MRTLQSILLSSAIAAGAAFLPAVPASALPLGPAAGATEAARLDASLPLIDVHHRRSSSRVAAGIVGGLIIGGIIASQRPYYYDYGYYPYPPYPYHPYPVYRGYPMDAAIAYCMRRFRSYDPYSMTYLGYDGRRHPCP